ncbi:regulatory factor, effector binding domain-containing protein [Scenedesmus sp. NREL 46B-D3]|nr:regulatory factor, effector binding domain-containing protein [Scenedesmus sp. NREL 46B-D3]
MKVKHFCTAVLAACLMLFIAQGAASRQFGIPVSSSARTAAVGSAAATAAAEASAALEDAGNRPWFCRGLDCPSFEVVETRGSLQLRRYKSAGFLVTRVEADSLLQAQVIASKRLLGYLAGDNEDSVKLAPTVPLNSVLLTADKASGTVKGHFFFAIYLPEEVQGDAPRPSNRDVRLIRLHRRAFWVQTFDSPLLTESSLIARGWDLITELQHLKRKVDDRFFVFSLYEPPLPFVPHHYELAVRAKCRRHGDAPTEAVLAAGQGVDDVHGDVHAWMSSAGIESGGVSLPGDDDDDYPLPEEGGGDPADNECEDDGPELSELLASM